MTLHRFRTKTFVTNKRSPKFVMFKIVMMPCNASPNRSPQDWELSWPVDFDLAGIAQGWQWHGRLIKWWHVEAIYQMIVYKIHGWHSARSKLLSESLVPFDSPRYVVLVCYSHLDLIYFHPVYIALESWDDLVK